MGEDKTSFWTDIKQYEEVLERDPDSYAFVPLSDLYRKLGLFDDALAAAQRGCSRHPNLVAGQLALGLACHEMGLKDECRTALEHVVRITPENIDAQRILSRVYADAGESALAESALRIVLDLSPNDLESRVIQDALSRAKGSDEGEPVPELTPIDETGISWSADVVETPIFEGYPQDAEQYPVEGEPSPTVIVPVEARGSFDQLETGDDEIIDLDDDSIILELEEVSEDEYPVEAEEGPDQIPLVSATMAELYVKQGFNDLAIGVYRQLVAENPMDTSLLARLDELLTVERRACDVSSATRSVEADFDVLQLSGVSAEMMAIDADQAEADPHRDKTVAILEGWLEGIRRVKACRSSIH